MERKRNHWTLGAMCALLGAIASTNASANSTWVMEGGALLANDRYKLCLDIEGGVVAGKPLIASDCSASDGQVFRHVDARIEVGNLCLDAVNGPIYDVVAAACNGAASQAWVRDSQRVLRAAGTPLCITVGGAGKAKLELCMDAQEQRFQAMTPYR